MMAKWWNHLQFLWKLIWIIQWKAISFWQVNIYSWKLNQFQRNSDNTKLIFRFIYIIMVSQSKVCQKQSLNDESIYYFLKAYLDYFVKSYFFFNRFIFFLEKKLCFKFNSKQLQRINLYLWAIKYWDHFYWKVIGIYI